MPDLNTVPSLDKLEKQYGFVNDAETGETYLLLGFPKPVHGPAFDAFGTDCVGSYGIHVMATENIPTGNVSLIVWKDIRSYQLGEQPTAILDMAELVKLGTEKGESPTVLCPT